MADFGQPGEPEMMLPKISQETLTNMIGTTRSRVSFSMNHFRKHGFLEYNGRIHVHKSLCMSQPHYRICELAVGISLSRSGFRISAGSTDSVAASRHPLKVLK